MYVVKKRPPIWDAVVAAIGEPPANAIFAWGDTIYSPGGGKISGCLLVHEQAHGRQQREIGSPGMWWHRYLADPAFRLEQEVEAYRAQVRSHAERPERRRCLARVSKDLASPMYGGLVTKEQARRLISAT